ncbi:MAG: hypothetical protein LBV34_00155, partial [Nocardiopsaceae bacterium]|nr:hypothetical protein [Nocardiopsaceae bacterium]
GLFAGQALYGVTANAAPTAAQGVRPRATGELDCNGYSPVQRSVDRALRCTDIRGLEHNERFFDNGHYIGHDEPSIRFLSKRAGSGNNVTFTEQLPRDPVAKPTVNHPGHDVTHWFELTPAPWFGMSICDPRSYPQRNCTPNSDSNAPHGAFAGGGGAFMEMQFYPPGFAPRADSVSCDNTHWCAALNIDSLEANAAGSMNNNCVEPVNFAFIQRNGGPAGPPSPQLSNGATVTPNGQTLLMNPGDRVRTHMFDASIGGGQHAFEIKISDLTTGQSGFMIASAHNGFMNTSMFNCNGHPFNFQPLFNTARSQNSIGWSVLLSGILTQYEIGHFEPCSKVTGPVAVGSDTTWLHCHGAYENAGPPDNTSGGQEPSDALCYKAGDTHGGTAPPNMVTGCLDDFTQNGDLDFDGTPYYADWPNSLKPGPFPSPFFQQQPTTTAGAGYSKIQFETDAPASEINTCAPDTPQGCAVPPPGGPGHFYPYYTQAKVGGQCVWEFGNMSNGNTFGRDHQYAHLVEHGFFKGQFDLASQPQPNPKHC